MFAVCGVCSCPTAEKNGIYRGIASQKSHKLVNLSSEKKMSHIQDLRRESKARKTNDANFSFSAPRCGEKFEGLLLVCKDSKWHWEHVRLCKSIFEEEQREVHYTLVQTHLVETISFLALSSSSQTNWKIGSWTSTTEAKRNPSHTLDSSLRALQGCYISALAWGCCSGTSFWLWLKN